eukprot:m.464093 g.464093  ORF g.464093 m.464093 type:complete len:586 (-) comp21615_c0_seq2:2649-4406(-)
MQISEHVTSLVWSINEHFVFSCMMSASERLSSAPSVQMETEHTCEGSESGRQPLLNWTQEADTLVPRERRSIEGPPSPQHHDAAMLALCAAALSPSSKDDYNTERAVTPEAHPHVSRDSPPTPALARTSLQPGQTSRRATSTASRSLRISNLKRMRTSYRMVEEVLENVVESDIVALDTSPQPTTTVDTEMHTCALDESPAAAVQQSSEEHAVRKSRASNLKRIRTSYQVVASTLQESRTDVAVQVPMEEPETISQSLISRSNNTESNSLHARSTSNGLTSDALFTNLATSRGGGSNLKRMRTSNQIISNLLEEARTNAMQTTFQTESVTCIHSSSTPPVQRHSVDGGKDFVVYTPLKFACYSKPMPHQHSRRGASTGSATHAIQDNGHCAQQTSTEPDRQCRQPITGGGPVAQYLRQARAIPGVLDRNCTNHGAKSVLDAWEKSSTTSLFPTSAGSCPGGIGCTVTHADESVRSGARLSRDPRPPGYHNRHTLYPHRVMVQSATTRAVHGVAPVSGILTLRHGTRDTGLRVTTWVASSTDRSRSHGQTPAGTNEVSGGARRGMTTATRWSAGHSTRARLHYVFA